MRKIFFDKRYSGRIPFLLLYNHYTEMLKQFKKFISDNNMIMSGDRILLAVSGGIDSMVMAHLFFQLGNETGIAHCNFSLRAEESDDDEKLVKKFASDNNIPFYSTVFKTKEVAQEKGLSIQMAARDLRYEWFEEIRLKHNYDSVAVAHNLNDNIETLIINLTRGTGLSGLTGIRPVNNKIIRPILFATRKTIVDYCNSVGLAFREDKSNADVKYTRNKIRHLVIPVLKEINPSIETTLNESAERFYELNEIISEFVSKLRTEITESKKNAITFNISKLRKYINNRSVIYELFKPFNLTNAQLNDLLKIIIGKTGGWISTGTHRIIKNRKDLIISGEESGKKEKFIVKNITGLKNVPPIKSAEYITITDSYEIPSETVIACVNAEKLLFPVVIRKWEAGDFFYPLGMKQKKKLSDYFIDKKFSIIDKENIFILESDGKIVWIIGERLDNRFRITPSTKRALLIKAADKPLIIRNLK